MKKTWLKMCVLSIFMVGGGVSAAAQTHSAQLHSTLIGEQVTVCVSSDKSLSKQINLSIGIKSSGCEVNYAASEGAAYQTLWDARNEMQYCVKKAKALTEKFESYGYNCSVTTDGIKEITSSTLTPLQMRRANAKRLSAWNERRQSAGTTKTAALTMSAHGYEPYPGEQIGCFW